MVNSCWFRLIRQKKVADLLTEAELMVDPTSFDFQLRVTSRRDLPLLDYGTAGKPAPPFTSFPSSFDYDMTSRRGIRLCQGYDVTRATPVALGIERGDTARFPQC